MTPKPCSEIAEELVNRVLQLCASTKYPISDEPEHYKEALYQAQVILQSERTARENAEKDMNAVNAIIYPCESIGEYRNAWENLDSERKAEITALRSKVEIMEKVVEAVRKHRCSCYVGECSGTRQALVDALAALDEKKEEPNPKPKRDE